MVRRAQLRRVPLLALAALACAHPQSRGATDDPRAPVTLRFAWPAGYSSQVVIAHESRRTGGPPTQIVARSRLVTERHRDEIRVLTRDLQAQGNDPDLEANAKLDEALIHVVSSGGTLLRVDGVDDALSVLAPKTAEERDRMRRALVRSAALDWELLVGAWAGQTLVPGEPRRKQLDAHVPDLAAVEAVLDVEYVLEGRVPCSEQETTRACVELSYRARVAPADHAATVERLRRLGSRDDPVPEDVYADLEVVLVTEPDTLVPHRMSQREQRRVRLVAPDGRVVETESRSEDALVFSPLTPRPAGGDAGRDL